MTAIYRDVRGSEWVKVSEMIDKLTDVLDII